MGNTCRSLHKKHLDSVRVCIKCRKFNGADSLEDGTKSMKNMTRNYDKQCCRSNLSIHISTGPSNIGTLLGITKKFY